MTIKHTWKKLATTTEKMLVNRKCKACGLLHRRMRYGHSDARRGYSRDEYRHRAGEQWTQQYRPPACTAVSVCPTCHGRGTVPTAPVGDDEDDT